MIQLTDMERGYLAGFLDGEGEISASLKMTCWVKFNNTNLDVIKWIHSKLGIGRIYSTRKHPISSKHKKCYAVMIFGEESKMVLHELIPCLIIKKRQAELILSYPTYSYRSRISYSSKQRRREIIRELRILNKRGTPPLDIEPIETEPQMTLFS